MVILFKKILLKLRDYRLSRKSKKTEGTSFIFQDLSGKRWSTIRIATIIFMIFTVVVSSVIGVSLFKNPNLAALELEEESNITSINESITSSSEDSFQVSLNNQNAVSEVSEDEIYAFYQKDDDTSKSSLVENIESLGVVMPDWYNLTSNQTITKSIEDEIDALAKKNNVKVIPRLSLESASDQEALHELLHSSKSRTAFINSLYEQVKEDKYAGINIDFTGLNEDDRELFTTFMSELYDLFHSHNLQVILTVPPDDGAYDYSSLSETVDRMILMLFDEHYEASEPGSVASANWSQQILDEFPVSSDKLIVSLANFGYDWTVDSEKQGEYLTYSEIMEKVSESDLKVQWDQDSRTPYVRYTEDYQEHIIWFLDAVTSYNQLKLAMEHGIKGVAIQNLGYEESSFWDILDDTTSIEDNVSELKTIENVTPIQFTGDGDIIKISSDSEEGLRSLKLDREGLISLETYKKYPVPYYIERFGGTESKKVALTFDDGPDPTFTPQILDILSEKNVKGTFFVLGKQAALYPEVVERIYREGHTIGSHTFSHSDITEDSSLTLKAELNSTQRLIEQITGHSTNLLRPPYTTDADYSVDELSSVFEFQEMGYTMVGSLIDSRDWESESSDEIVKRVTETNLGNGNIILLHDAGGDRSTTIEALPEIIDTLREKGYTFVTPNELIGKDRNDVMPTVEESSNLYMVFYKIADTVYIFLSKFGTLFFALAIIIGITRLLFLVFFSFKHKKNYKNRQRKEEFNPSVSVILPAYNEENVIENTIHSILKSDYSNFELIVVDDGSTDQTAKIVSDRFQHDERVSLITKQNGGKSSAINRGFNESNGEIIVIFDADTSIAHNAISLLVDNFSDEQIAAVAGNVKIGNVRNLLTLWQHVEYVTGCNLERRSFDELNCITVVPGAIGAWRKKAVVEVGYFEDDTLAEDTDVTLKLLRKGYRITYEPNAYAYTEAPENLKSFIKQRVRWSYGILQCLWKHRGALFNPKQKTLGFVGLPNMWLQYVLQALAPLADLIFVVGLFGDTTKILTFYVGFLVVDLLASLYSFRLEKANVKPLLLLFVQRIVYRYFLTYTVWKSIISAFKGILVGWNKLKRSGNVKLPDKEIEKGA